MGVEQTLHHREKLNHRSSSRLTASEKGVAEQTIHFQRDHSEIGRKKVCEHPIQPGSVIRTKFGHFFF
jgi:hypothetical protein